jgi:type II secretory pathway component HofQ
MTKSRRNKIVALLLSLVSPLAAQEVSGPTEGEVTVPLQTADNEGIPIARRLEPTPTPTPEPAATPEVEEVEIRRARPAPNLVQTEIKQDGCPIGLAFRMLAEQAGINFIEPPLQSEETVSFRFYDITPLEAFERLAQTRGFRVVSKDGVTTLSRPDIKTPSFLTVEKYVLKHAEPTWVLPGVANLLGIELKRPAESLPTVPKPADQSSEISSVQGGSNNSPYGGGTDSVESAVPNKARWIPSLPWDTPLSAGGFAGGKEGGGEQRAVFIDRKTNAIIVRASPDEQDLVRKFIIDADVPEPQIVIEVRMIEIEKRKGVDQGIDWNGTFGEGVTFRVKSSDELASTPISLGSAAQFFWMPATVFLEWPDVEATFRNFAKQGNATALNTPTVVTQSGVPVSIRSTTEESIELYTPQNNVIGTGGGTVVDTNNLLQTDIRTFVTGVTMDVLPRLVDNGYVLLNCNPSVSSRVGETVAASGQRLPVINRRSMATTTAVRSGETLVIGGLVRVENEKSLNGIPPADKIPLIGNILFGDRQVKFRRTNLLIFITPRVIYPNQRQVIYAPSNDADAIEAMKREENVFDAEVRSSPTPAGKPKKP